MATTEPVSVYPLGVSGGFVAGFCVELVFDRDHPGTGFDLVGVEAVCQLCGGRSGYRRHPVELWRDLVDHAARHEPEPPGGRSERPRPAATARWTPAAGDGTPGGSAAL
jgi:hypothetical protein